MRIRYLIERTDAAGTRFYWQPGADLRASGWLPQRLRTAEGLPCRTRAEAAAAAERINADVDAWRAGQPAPTAPGKPARGRAPAGSVSALITDYRASRWWQQLAARTRKDYGWCLDIIEEWAGDQPARAVTAPAVQALHDSLARRTEGAGRARRVIETPAKAAAVIRVLRLLLAAGIRLGYVASNAAARPGLSHTRKREPALWSAAQLAHMAAVADRLGWRSVATAMHLNGWIGQRVQDVLDLPPYATDAGALVIAQGKTGRRVALPIHLVPDLVARLAAEAARPGAPRSLSHLLLHDRTGQPWRLSTFEHVFADIRAAAAAGLPATAAEPELPPMPGCAALLFRELRHFAVTRMHEAGVDEQGIAGITGHTPQSVGAMLHRHYLIRTARAAEGAFRKRLAAENAV
jgi:hypothetical protein